MISDKYELWMGNLTPNELVTEAGELLGFGTGGYRQQVVGHSICNSSRFPQNWV